jgi:hypothetical protein
VYIPGDGFLVLGAAESSAAAALSRRIQSFVSAMSARRPHGDGFACLVCAADIKGQRDCRRHVLSHFVSGNEDAARAIDDLMAPFVREQHKNLFSCLVCKKLLKLNYGRVRFHFVERHLTQVAFDAP